ncbi:MAG: MATE family efflux transporter, partial [Erysipelotrichaceae bacterium]|nr:MATE family efflux transporter [Erysipelotrichaceae bacterium]
MRKTNTIDMLNGPIFSKILLFSIPLMLSSVLQLLFNAADIIVVGQFAGSNSLAAVGATSALINLLVNLFVGVSIGSSVVMGKYVGARDFDNVEKTIHASMYFAIVSGIVMIFVGAFLAKPLLEMMATPLEIIDLSTLYMWIYFLGMPGFMVYNFGAAILRTVGDTKRPLYFLGVAGIVNVVLNLLLVILFKLGVAGVAIATMVSQYISAALVTLSLMKSDDYMKLKLKELKFHKDIVMEMLKVGLPAGLQGVIFNISNVLIQSSVNSFGSLVMAGNTAAANIEGFVYVSMNSIHQAALTFTSQNMGAKNYHRIDKILINCLVIVTAVGLIL